PSLYEPKSCVNTYFIYFLKKILIRAGIFCLLRGEKTTKNEIIIKKPSNMIVPRDILREAVKYDSFPIIISGSKWFFYLFYRY
ncbi:MAG: hypothetical protein LBQ50_04710, partial [Planctomycetaceae bacterium]|nr:hypothetical protein [Planctomycetaceae bacterium]